MLWALAARAGGLRSVAAAPRKLVPELRKYSGLRQCVPNVCEPVVALHAQAQPLRFAADPQPSNDSKRLCRA